MVGLAGDLPRFPLETPSSVQMSAQALVTPELFLLRNGRANEKLEEGLANTLSFVSVNYIFSFVSEKFSVARGRARL